MGKDDNVVNNIPVVGELTLAPKRETAKDER